MMDTRSTLILKELMNQGFIIWSLTLSDRDIFHLQKVPTSNNMKMSITDEVQPATNIMKFKSYHDALMKAMELAGI